MITCERVGGKEKERTRRRKKEEEEEVFSVE
jgi:hypothetical protein